ncbi:MAG TPA: cupin domain-containing protein [Anaerolineae bacterium]|nr:cupin domain-containing protein [Anaerolineae bacterium]
MKRLFSAADIRIWKECGETKIDLAPDDIVTPEAEDVAKALNIALVRMTTDPLAAQVREVVKEMQSRAQDKRPPSARGAKVTLVQGNRVEFQPFPFDVKRDDMGIRTADVISERDSSPLGAGFMRFENGSFAWTLNYDEIEYVIDGELEIRVSDESYVGHAGDVLFIPRGTNILFCTRTFAYFLYVTYPANWTAQ